MFEKNYHSYKAVSAKNSDRERDRFETLVQKLACFIEQPKNI